MATKTQDFSRQMEEGGIEIEVLDLNPTVELPAELGSSSSAPQGNARPWKPLSIGQRWAGGIGKKSKRKERAPTYVRRSEYYG